MSRKSLRRRRGPILTSTAELALFVFCWLAIGAAAGVLWGLAG